MDEVEANADAVGTAACEGVLETRIQVEQPPRVEPPYPSILQSLGILLIITLVSLGCSPLFLLSRGFGSEVAIMVTYLSSMALSLAIVHALRRRRLGTSTFYFGIDSGKLLLPLILTSIALLFGVVAPISSLIPVSEDTGKGFGELMMQSGWPTFVYFVIGAPVFEELIFRGIILDGYLNRYRPVTAILVSSLLFGLFHFNPWQFVTGSVLGCFLGWVYFRTRSVGPCIVVHMAANLSGYLVRLAMRSPDLAQQLRESDARGVTGEYLIFSAVCLIVITVSVWYLRREFDRLAMAEVEVEALPAVLTIEGSESTFANS